MPLTRREFQAAALAAGSLAASQPLLAAPEVDPMLIIDTHQHLWDLDKFRVPWLGPGAKSQRPENYRAAIAGLMVQAVYMEVDVAPEQHLDEAKYVDALARDPQEPTVAAVVGGRPAAAEFARYLDQLAALGPTIKGVRQVLHGGQTPAGCCLQDPFVRGVRLLGERGLSFDLCLRWKELGDGRRLAEQCPGTRFVLDHCGNAEPAHFAKNAGEQARADALAWRRDIERLAEQKNIICKISGIVARAPKSWQPADLAPIVDHCLDTFGPDRVVFGSDWPVCLRGATLREWVAALQAIVASRPAADQAKLWSENARKFYALDR